MIKEKLDIKSIGWLMGILFLFSACGIMDDDDCEPEVETYNVSFSFVYEYNMSYEDLLAEEVEHIDLFVYDYKGELYRHVETPRTAIAPQHVITLEELPVGRYTAVAWGNCSINDNYEFIGTDYLSTHILNLSCVDEERVVTDKDPGNHFQASTTFTVTGGGGDKEVPVELVKNTNFLRIIVRGMKPEDWQKAEELLYARVESNNRAYNYDNSWASDEWISYVPHHYELVEEEQEVVVEFHILQLSPEDEDTKITLNFRDGDSRIHFMEEPLIPNLRNQYVTSLRAEVTEPIPFNEFVGRSDEFEIIFDMEYEDTIDGIVIRIKPWDGISQPGHL